MSIYNPAIGTRADGKRYRRERWYETSILGLHVPESETIVPDWPHPKAGQRVALKEMDEADYLMNFVLRPPLPRPDEFGP